MVAVRFLARTLPRWTALQRTSVGRWPSPLCRVACASVPLSSSHMQLVLPSRSHS